MKWKGKVNPLKKLFNCFKGMTHLFLWSIFLQKLIWVILIKSYFQNILETKPGIPYYSISLKYSKNSNLLVLIKENLYNRKICASLARKKLKLDRQFSKNITLGNSIFGLA